MDQDIRAALSDVDRMRAQLAASTRFQGFTPAIAAVTGCLALALAAMQSAPGSTLVEGRMVHLVWIGLALLCAGLIGADAVARSRRVHRAMADIMVNTTLRQFLPSGVAGALITFILLSRAPQAAWTLPGLWQLLMALGIFAALANLPRRMALAGGWYFLSGAASLALASDGAVPSPWLMGAAFGVGQLLVAAILHDAGRRGAHG